MAVIDGTTNNDHFRGTGLSDTFNMQDGGSDTVRGLGGDDVINFGDSLTRDDRIDGGDGTADAVSIQGDYTGANALVLGGNTVKNVESLVCLNGFDYDITMRDANVAAGAQLAIYASQLVGHRLVFNGSHETDGSFILYGGDGNDVFVGSAHGDLLYGGMGADTLYGGGGPDTFGYGAAMSSTGTGYDTVVGFDTAQDKIIVATHVDAVDMAAEPGLTRKHFDDNLQAAVTATVLQTGHAVLMTAVGGKLDGHLFLVIDTNGVAGYQSGQDYVIAFKNAVGMENFDLDNIGP